MQRALRLLSVSTLTAVLLGALGAQGAQAQATRPPVIIIPGVGGSEFTAQAPFRLTVDNGHGGTYTHDYSSQEKVWVNKWQVAALGSDDYFDALKLKYDGVTPVAPAVQPSDIYHDGYDDLIGYLQAPQPGRGYRLTVDLWTFYYDWRSDIAALSAQLDAQITHALIKANGGQTDQTKWTVRRVNLVAHSMGGLIGRHYISVPQRASRVDQLITLGTPQLGAAGFLKALVYGDTLGPWFLGIGLNPEEIKDVVQNIPGGYQLLPSLAYDSYYDNSSSARLRPWVENRDIDGDGRVLGVMSYDQVSQVLARLGKNQPLIAKARDFHNALDRGRHGGVNGVRWSALVGVGYGTLGQMREYTGVCSSLFSSYPCPKRDEIPVDGDGTVATLSASIPGPFIDSGARVTTMPRAHTDLVKRDYSFGFPVGDGPALPWIVQRLSETSTQPAAFTTAAGATAAGATAVAAQPATRQPPTEAVSGLWLSALGPVAVQVRDDAGRVTGRDRGMPDSARAEVPETRHERLPGSEFAFIKRDAAYTIALDAESTGSLDLKVRVLGNGKVTRTAVYLGVALSERGHAQLVLNPGAGRAAAPQGWPELQVDADGDGIAEASIPAAAVLDEREGADIDPPELIVDRPRTNDSIPGAATVQWRASDHGAGLLRQEATIDPGTATQRIVRNGDTVALPPGQHRLLVVALDRAGNASSSEINFSVL